MKKILVAIDGLNYKPSVTELAISLALHTNGHLVGLFLHDRTYHSYKIYNIDTGMLMSNESIEKGEAHDKQLRKEAIEQFVAACNLHRIPHTVREDKNIARHKFGRAIQSLPDLQAIKVPEGIAGVGALSGSAVSRSGTTYCQGDTSL
jgi:hypothetical protein